MKHIVLEKGFDVFFTDKANNLYIAGRKRVQKYNPKKQAFQKIFEISEKFVRRYKGLCLDKEGNLWSALEGKDSLTHLLKLDLQSYQYKILQDSSAKYTKAITFRSVFFTKDKEGYIWKKEGGILSRINPQQPEQQKVYILKGIIRERKEPRSFSWIKMTCFGSTQIVGTVFCYYPTGESKK